MKLKTVLTDVGENVVYLIYLIKKLNLILVQLFDRCLNFRLMAIKQKQKKIEIYVPKFGKYDKKYGVAVEEK